MLYDFIQTFEKKGQLKMLKYFFFYFNIDNVKTINGTLTFQMKKNRLDDKQEEIVFFSSFHSNPDEQDQYYISVLFCTDSISNYWFTNKDV